VRSENCCCVLGSGFCVLLAAGFFTLLCAVRCAVVRSAVVAKKADNDD
jgi:hypothetical protein